MPGRHAGTYRRRKASDAAAGGGGVGEGDDGFGAFVESVKRKGWEASSAGRRDICARLEDGLRASHGV